MWALNPAQECGPYIQAQCCEQCNPAKSPTRRFFFTVSLYLEAQRNQSHLTVVVSGRFEKLRHFLITNAVQATTIYNHGGSLANSRAFQRFAVRTSKRIEDISSIAAKKKEQLAEQMKDLSRNMDSFKDR
ncbi:hypothetical protein L3X38_034982 [Prunus dulcis]|uniref:Uncharacterized protein n=1 Tax=Prunus dulcis TaxID=3755 RepID=A0AAD4VJ23_PRUDU|nr:hypothetical protein L3X38_034982 [Prunus dulcis]